MLNLCICQALQNSMSFPWTLTLTQQCCTGVYLIGYLQLTEMLCVGVTDEMVWISTTQNDPRHEMYLRYFRIHSPIRFKYDRLSEQPKCTWHLTLLLASIEIYKIRPCYTPWPNITSTAIALGITVGLLTVYQTQSHTHGWVTKRIIYSPRGDKKRLDKQGRGWYPPKRTSCEL